MNQRFKVKHLKNNFFILILCLLIFSGCSNEPPAKTIEEFQKKQIIAKQNELNQYLTERQEQDKITPPDLNADYEVVITEKFGKKYAGFINGFRVIVEGDDVSLGERLKIKVYEFTRTGKSARAEIIERLGTGENSDEVLELGKSYDISIAGVNKRGEYFGIINQHKVIVIGATQSNKKYKITIIDRDTIYYYAQIIEN